MQYRGVCGFGFPVDDWYRGFSDVRWWLQKPFGQHIAFRPYMLAMHAAVKKTFELISTGEWRPTLTERDR